MGFFDRFSSKKPEPPSAPAVPVPVAAPSGSTAPVSGVKPRLIAAREKLEAKDLPAALAIYEEVLASAGDRADVLVTISGDLGTHGHVAEIIELIAPRYDADRHGPATGLNLLQAYLAVRNADAAQHVLDILFALNRPELEDRLHGFSNAIAELLTMPQLTAAGGDAGASGEGPKIGLITLSRPVWFYGLEPLAEKILPSRDGRVRRIGFAQLALPGKGDLATADKQPEDELARLSRAIPLWLAETFYFSSAYAPIAAVGLMNQPNGENYHVIFGAEWRTENLRQFVDSTEGGLDYIVTGALQSTAGDYELLLRIWEVKKYRERKALTARWTPATVNDELKRLHEEFRRYMEWAPAGAGLTYAVPTQPRAWLETLGASLGLFMAEKTLLPVSRMSSPAYDLREAAQQAASSEAASLAFLTLRARAAKLGVELPPNVTLASSPLVAEAEAAVK